jgi:hypothetical protein
MKLIEPCLNPNRRQLRQFGLAGLAAVPLAGWLWSGSPEAFWALAALGALLGLLAVAAPRALTPAFVAASLLSLPIGIIVGELAVAVVFFGLFVPLGILFRLIGRDALQLRIDRRAETYWQPKRQPTDAASYLRMG